jgi:hypothetical protein
VHVKASVVKQHQQRRLTRVNATGKNMKKYFFDRVGSDRAEYDYRGRDLPSLDAARRLAELIALDLEIDQDGTWSGWAVSVRDAVGQQFLSVPVSASDLVMA